MTSPGTRTGNPSEPLERPWWYVIVLTPMIASLVAIVGVAVGTAAVVTATADLSTYAPAYFALALVGLPLTVLYPLALFRDSTLIAVRCEDWTPDSGRYTVAAVLSIATLFVAAIPLSWYYLRKRRRHLDRP